MDWRIRRYIFICGLALYFFALFHLVALVAIGDGRALFYWIVELPAYALGVVFSTTHGAKIQVPSLVVCTGLVLLTTTMAVVCYFESTLPVALFAFLGLVVMAIVQTARPVQTSRRHPMPWK